MKKGFTLVEVIAVISLISVLAVMAFTSFIYISKASIEKNYEHEVDRFIKSATLYVDNNDNLRNKVYNNEEVMVSLNTLFENKYIESDITNPLTKKNFNYDSYVIVRYKNKIVGEFINRSENNE